MLHRRDALEPSELSIDAGHVLRKAELKNRSRSGDRLKATKQPRFHR